MTPVAPDYVGQVRGIIGDLRENYLKKQQLFQQDQQEKNRLALSYAQLDQQAANQAQEAQINTARIASADAQNAGQLIKAQSEAQSKALDRDLDERKFSFEQTKAFLELAQKNALNEQEVSAARLESELMLAIESGDGLKVAEATNKAYAAGLNIKQQTDAYKNAYALLANKRMLEQDLANVRTRPQAIAVINRVNELNVAQMNPERAKDELSKANAEFYSLGNQEKVINDMYSQISQEKEKQRYTYQTQDFGAAVGEFETRAIRGRLPKPIQKQWDDLQAKYPGKEDRLSENYINEKTRLLYETTDEESQTELKSWAKRINDIERNFLSQRPELAAKVVNPETGVVENRFPVAPPDVSYSVGYDAAINPLTGKINPAKRKEYDAWINDVSQKGYLNLPSQNPFMQAVMEAASARGLPPVSPAPSAQPGQTPATPQPSKTPATAQPNQETAQAGQPQIKVTQFNFPQVAEAGTATIPTAPSAQGATKVQLSPETMSKVAEVVNMYNANPDALYRGRPVREVIAKLKQQLGELPGLGQTPESNVVNQGQNR
jgi:hypothetical protein